MILRFSWLFACIVALGGCSCEGDVGAESCTTTADCEEGQLCVDGECRAQPDGGPAGGPDGGCLLEDRCAGSCCAEGEECVDGFLCLPLCENERCGDNGRICCDDGDICLDGVVCAADCPASEALCGADLDVCCPSGDVCVDDACRTPGMACGDDFDCLTEGDYCEPTIGRCLSIPGEPLCELRPEFDRVALEVEWHWEGVTAGGTLYEHVMSTPMVGDVTGDGIPDVVAAAYATSGLGVTVLVALNGDDGTLIFNTAPGVDNPDHEGVALANLDPADDALEIVYRGRSGGTFIVDGDGTSIARRTTGTAGSSFRAAPAVADLNADGTPDVVVGCHAMNGLDIEDASMDFFDRGACSRIAVVADLDGDGEPEVTGGGLAVSLDGSTSWENTAYADSYVAIADLDGDGAPEVVNVKGGTIAVLAGATGEVLIGPGGSWADGTFAIPGGGEGGPPTVADFDADGLPEMSTAGLEAYAVYDPDCLPTPPRAGGDACSTGTFLKWDTPTQDLSSSRTGSSVFDFQGDGAAEVVYNDECFLHVYDGRTGEDVLAEVRPNSSRTSSENPIVVDVDRDGNSEIVLPANRDQALGRDNCPAAWSAALGVPVGDLPTEIASGTAGIFAFGDPDDRWVRTRPIWNQHSYHVTNVTDRGAVPAMERDNWAVPGLNNYRQNVQGDGVFNVPNLVAELDAVPACSAGEMRLTAVVRNAGTRGVAAGVRVDFYQLTPGPEAMVGSATTSAELLPGATERVTVSVADIPTDVELRYEVRLDEVVASDDPGDVAECDESDNAAQATGECPSLL